MDRESIARKIRSLLAMTVENGASEAEAMFAMKKASQLMREYQMSMSEAELRAEDLEHMHIEMHMVWGKKQPKEYQIKFRMASHISKLCGVKMWTERWHDKMAIVGLKTDVQFAHYLLETLAISAFVEGRKHLAALPKEMKKDTRIVWRDFYQGFAVGVGQKVNELIKNMHKDATSDGTSVVWVKNNIVDTHFENMGIKLHKNPSLTIREMEHFARGKEKGKQQSLTRPVEFDDQKVISHQK